jgi:hypothetical protein
MIAMKRGEIIFDQIRVGIIEIGREVRDYFNSFS